MNKEKNSSGEFEPPKKRRRIQENLIKTKSNNDYDEKVSSNSNDKTTESKQDGEVLNSDACQDRIETVLCEIENDGQVSVSGKASHLPRICGLNVSGIGNISLPLTEREAKVLINVCEKAPYGKGLKTNRNDNIRKSYQLDSTKFHFDNPKWNIGIKKLAKEIGNKLWSPTIDSDNSLVTFVLFFLFIFCLITDLFN